MMNPINRKTIALITLFLALTTVILDCNGYEKKIYFWTPDGYDPNSDEKYATIYVLDGQGEVNLNDPDRRPDGCEYIPDQVRSMIQNTGYKAIVVAVSTYGNMTDIIRDDELIPDIGECETVGDVLYHAGVPGAVRNGRRSVALVLALQGRGVERVSQRKGLHRPCGCTSVRFFIQDEPFCSDRR